MKRMSLQLNIPLLYALEAVEAMSFFMPVIVLFFQENGLTVSQVLILQALFSITMIVLEIPSGYMADQWGRRRTIITGVIATAIGFGIYPFANSFWDFLVAEIFLGIGMSIVSGANSALLYDTLLALGKVDKYKYYEGHIQFFSSIASAFGAITGGFLAGISLRTPVIVEAVVFAFSIPLAILLTEPKRIASVAQSAHLVKLKEIVVYALHGHKTVKWLMIYGGLASAATLTMVWLAQPYMQTVGVPVVWFGVVMASFHGVIGVTSLYAEQIERRLGQKLSVALLLLLPVAGFVISGALYSLYAFPVLYLFHIARGLHTPIMKDYINRHIESAVRATVLSVNGLVGRLWYVLLAYPLGLIHDAYGLQWTFLLTGVIFLALGSYALRALFRNL